MTIRRHLPHILVTLILIVILVGSGTHVAHASGCGIPWNTKECVVDVVSYVINILLDATAWILALAGTLLNMSMNITLHIKDFVDGTPAVYTIWRSIRDISGMFMIFTLLFAALKMILAPIGVPGPSVGNLIKTVVIAGVLINFSFFVTGLGIDVSNIVSLQLYSTIAPNSSLNYKQLEGGTGTTLKTRFADGGISDIFMKSLKISNFYDAETASLNPTGRGGNAPNGFSASLQIIFGGVFGIMVMITAAFSFFLAALAFIVRFVILIMLLGFSPIWFAAYAIPDLKTYADKWFDTYKGQLLFMPVYLLLMYFALSVLTSSNLFQAGFATNQSDGGEWWANYMILGINAAIVIIMLNMPLLAAIKVGGEANKWMDRGLGAGAIWAKFGQKTVGKTASRINESGAARWAYSRAPNAGLLVSKGLSSVSSSGFGMKKGSYDDSAKAHAKDLESLDKRIGTVKRENYSSATKFFAAKTNAKKMGENFTKSLSSKSPLAYLMGNRTGNMAYKYKNEKDTQDKESLKNWNKDKANAEGEISDNNIQIAFIDKELARGITEGGVTLSPAAKIGLESRKKKLQSINSQQRVALETINEEISKIKQGTNLDDLAKEIGGLKDKIEAKP